jgi:hypothetical protein
MKVSIDELNDAYAKANEYKLDGYPVKKTVFVEIDRNPLTDKDYFDEESNFVTVVKLKFEFDDTLGSRGAYRLVSDIEIVDKDEEYI